MVIKLFVFVSVCASLVFFHFETLGNPTLETLGSGEFRIYSREYVRSPYVQRKISIATGFIYFTHSNYAARLRAKFNAIDGESITLDSHKTPREIMRTLGGYREIETLDHPIVHITYAFSGRGRDFIDTANGRVNLQISDRAGIVTVGWPVILGSH